LKQPTKTRLDLTKFEEGIISGDRIILGQALTLIESTLEEDQEIASSLLEKILPRTGNTIRIGITGVPGVGKSSFIEAFGKYITGLGKKLAVLTIDPTSPITKGSILGDKTRMDILSKDPLAFIRPTPSSLTIGGVANKTREAMLLCEAAGFEVIIIETVGVGQSEISVRGMVDFFLLLVLAGAGDELQGIKKGILEIADTVIVTKADGDNIANAREAQSIYQQSFHVLPEKSSGWKPMVLTTSVRTGEGIKDVWKVIIDFQQSTKLSGYFDRNRSIQTISWFREYFKLLLEADIQKFENIQEKRKNLEQSVIDQVTTPQVAARQLLEAYHQSIRDSIGK
jgi:LAO/AO transport system kinase